jgi:hypothetical protein
MALLIEFVVRRHLKATGKYQEAKLGGTPPRLDGLVDEETLWGWYTNPPPHSDCKLVFTSAAIYALEGEASERLPLDDIEDCVSPTSKQGLAGLTVVVNGRSHFLRVFGSYGEGEISDAFALYQVMYRVVSANRRRREQIHA